MYNGNDGTLRQEIYLSNATTLSSKYSNKPLCFGFPTISAVIERRRSIYFYDFWAVHNGQFWYFFVQKYFIFWTKNSPK